MSEFLSKLIARSFSDAPVIQPRVPSLFEPTAIEFFEETNMSAPLREVSSVEKTATAKSSANASDALGEERRPKPNALSRQPASANASPETKRLIVPLASSRGEEDHSGSTNQVSETFPKTRTFESLRRKDFSSVEQRSPTSAPIVHVTIGRVEVRAVQPPAPAPKPAKSAPAKLSLEDYLRERERGAR
jgi:hypothetical protein